MKWPETLTLIRHDESAYNALKNIKESDPLYKEFRESFEEDYKSPITLALAYQLHQRLSLKYGDYNTPLAEGAGHKTIGMAKRLKEMIKLPDIIFVSPYERTLHTLERMKEGWPELDKVRIVEEGRIREQEHGLATLYNDWRIFHSIHPEQRQLFLKEGSYWYRYPQGESVEDVRERTRSWFYTLTRDFSDKNVLAVTHHLTILAVRANLERLSAKQFLDLDENEKPINAGVTIYKGDPTKGSEGKLILQDYNLKLY